MIPNLWKAYGAIWSLYLILAVADGVRGAAWKGGHTRTPILPLVCAAVHGVYGLSTLVGLFMFGLADIEDGGPEKLAPR